jgi:hypothetical protein
MLLNFQRESPDNYTMVRRRRGVPRRHGYVADAAWLVGMERHERGDFLLPDRYVCRIGRSHY